MWLNGFIVVWWLCLFSVIVSRCLLGCSMWVVWVMVMVGLVVQVSVCSISIRLKCCLFRFSVCMLFWCIFILENVCRWWVVVLIMCLLELMQMIECVCGVSSLVVMLLLEVMFSMLLVFSNCSSEWVRVFQVWLGEQWCFMLLVMVLVQLVFCVCWVSMLGICVVFLCSSVLLMFLCSDFSNWCWCLLFLVLVWQQVDMLV